MTLHEFAIVLDRPLVDDDYDRLYEVGLDDATPGNEHGRGYIAVARQAESLLDALTSALADLRHAGLRPISLADEDLVTLTVIAQRTGRTHESVRLLAAGKRGSGGFPAPQVPGKPALYSWTAVADWFAEALGVATQPHDDDARLLAAASHLLRAQSLATPAELAALAA